MQALPNKIILVVNHENITRCRYQGAQREMLVCNSLFRIGGAAALMTNRCGCSLAGPGWAHVVLLCLCSCQQPAVSSQNFSRISGSLCHNCKSRCSCCSMLLHCHSL